jgi:hypothetical protein
MPIVQSAQMVAVHMILTLWHVDLVTSSMYNPRRARIEEVGPRQHNLLVRIAWQRVEPPEQHHPKSQHNGSRATKDSALSVPRPAPKASWRRPIGGDG